MLWVLPLWIAVFVLWIPFMFIFIRHRRVHPIKGRAPLVVICFNIVLFLFFSHLCAEIWFQEKYPCLVSLFLCFFFGSFGSLGLYLYRLVRLLFAYEITKNIMEMNKKPHHVLHWEENWFTRHRSFIGKQYLLKFYFLLLFLFVMEFTLITSFGSETLRSACTAVSIFNPWQTVWHYSMAVVTLLVIFLIGCVGLRILLYHRRSFVIELEFCIFCTLLLICLASIIIVYFGYLKKIVLFYILTISIHLFFLISTVWPSYRSMRDRCFNNISLDEENQEERAKLSDLLHIEEGFTCFLQHLQSEFSAENLLFWRDVEEYRELPLNDLSIVREKCGEINETFIVQGAPCPVNISYSLLNQLQNKIAAVPPSGPLTEEVLHVYDEAQEEVYKLMASDSFARFQRSPAYQQFSLELEGSKHTVSWLNSDDKSHDSSVGELVADGKLKLRALQHHIRRSQQNSTSSINRKKRPSQYRINQYNLTPSGSQNNLSSQHQLLNYNNSQTRLLRINATSSRSPTPDSSVRQLLIHSNTNSQIEMSKFGAGGRRSSAPERVSLDAIRENPLSSPQPEISRSEIKPGSGLYRRGSISPTLDEAEYSLAPGTPTTVTRMEFSRLQSRRFSRQSDGNRTPSPPEQGRNTPGGTGGSPEISRIQRLRSIGSQGDQTPSPERRATPEPPAPLRLLGTRAQRGGWMSRIVGGGAGGSSTNTGGRPASPGWNPLVQTMIRTSSTSPSPDSSPPELPLRMISGGTTLETLFEKDNTPPPLTSELDDAKQSEQRNHSNPNLRVTVPSSSDYHRTGNSSSSSSSSTTGTTGTGNHYHNNSITGFLTTDSPSKLSPPSFLELRKFQSQENLLNKTNESDGRSPISPSSNIQQLLIHGRGSIDQELGTPKNTVGTSGGGGGGTGSHRLFSSHTSLPSISLIEPPTPLYAHNGGIDTGLEDSLRGLKDKDSNNHNFATSSLSQINSPSFNVEEKDSSPVELRGRSESLENGFLGDLSPSPKHIISQRPESLDLSPDQTSTNE